MPRNHSILIEMLEVGYDILEVTEKTIRFWLDCDIEDVLHYQSNAKSFSFDPHSCIKLEDLVHLEEVQNSFIPRKNLLVANVEHDYYRSFRSNSDPTSLPTDDLYHVTCYVCLEDTNKFILENVLKFLPKNRLKGVLEDGTIYFLGKK